jgi:hypothetical protein
MKWEEVREVYPHEWVVCEAIDQDSYDGKRIIHDVAIIDRFSDSLDAMKR